MRAGRRDRLIEIQASYVVRDDAGEQIVVWATTASEWAEKVENHGAERFAAQQLAGAAVRSFRFLWNDATKTITVLDRIMYEGRPFDILDVREIGYHEGIEVDCKTAGELPMEA